MKKLGILVLVLLLMITSAMVFADADKDELSIIGVDTEASQSSKKGEYTVEAKEVLEVNEQGKYIDVTLTLKTTQTKPVNTGDASPALLFVALMAISAAAAIFLIRRKKLNKAMSVVLSIALLLTWFVSGTGIVNALDFSNTKVDVAFTDKILEAFEFDDVSSLSAGSCTLVNNGAEVVGIEWVLGELAKDKTQTLKYRLNLKNTVPDETLGKTLKVSDTSFTIGTESATVLSQNITVKVVFTNERYDLIYDANGGSGAPPTEQKVAGTYTLHDGMPPTRAAVGEVAVVFVGWTRSQADATAKIYSKNDTAPASIVTSVTITNADVTVYAVWGYDENGDGTADVLEDKYTLSYALNGGTGGPSPSSVTVIEGSYTISSTVPTASTEAGKTIIFWGWTTSTTVSSTPYGAGATFPGTKIAAGSTITISGNTPLTAVWAYDTGNTGTPDPEKTQYTLNYALNGGTGGPNPSSVPVVAGPYTVSSTVPTAPTEAGKTIIFWGWTTSTTALSTPYGAGATFPGTKIAAGGSITISGNTTLTAVWAYDTGNTGTPDPEKTQYTLNYALNGGSGGPSPSSVPVVAGPYTISSTVPTAPTEAGKTIIFWGWTTSTTVSSTPYGAGASFPGTKIVAGGSITISGNTTLTAVWAYDTGNTGIPDPEKTSYTLSYALNGGTGGPDPSSLTVVSGSYTISSTVPTAPTEAGKTIIFWGWTTSTTASSTPYGVGATFPGTKIAAGSSIMISSNTTLTAVWAYDTGNTGTPDPEKTTYTLFYVSNGGTDGPSPATVLVVAGPYTISSTVPTAPTEAGKTIVFWGWSETEPTKTYGAGDTFPGGAAAKISASSTITISGDTYLWAVWAYDTGNTGTPDPEKTQYTLSYALNGGTGGPSPSSVPVVVGPYTISSTVPTAPTEAGKTIIFWGWTTSTTASSTPYGAGATFPGTKITAGSTITISGNTPLTAVWAYDTGNTGIPDPEKTQYTLSYALNGGANGPSPASVPVVAGSYTISSTVPTHANVNDTPVIFWGWTTSTTASSTPYGAGDTFPGTKIAAGGSITISGNTTLTAVWAYDTGNTGIPDPEKTQYTLNYALNGGTGGPNPSSVTVVAGPYTISSTVPTAPTEAGKTIIFWGWTTSTTASSTPYGAGTSFPGTKIAAGGSITISGNTTLTAVWAYDTGNTGIPDPEKTQYTLNYVLNGGTGGPNPSSVPVVAGPYTVSSTVPTHANVNSTPVIFWGWTTSSALSTPYGAGDTFPGTKIAAGGSITISGHTTLYAVWAYDTGNTGTPDPEKTTYSITLIYYNDNISTTPLATETIPHVIAGSNVTSAIMAAKGSAWLDAHRVAPRIAGVLDSSTPLSAGDTLSGNVTYRIVYHIPTVTNFTVSASGAASQTATSDNFTLALMRNTSAAQTITLTGVVTGTYLSDTPGLTLWTPGGTNSAWGATPVATGSQTYVVTVPINTIGTMTVTARAKDDASKVVVVTITVVEFRLYYSEGNATYGSLTPFVPTNANTGTATTATSFTINLTSPVGGATQRHFTTYNATTTAVVNQTATFSQTGTGATFPTASGSLKMLSIPVGYTGTITLVIGGAYTITVNVTADDGIDTAASAQAKANAAQVGETFKASGIEWRVLHKVNGEALVMAEHVLGTSVMNATSTNWDTVINWKGSSLRTNLNNSTNTYSYGQLTFNSVIKNTDLITRHGWNSDNYAGSTSATTDRIFLLSEEEYFGTRGWGGGQLANLDYNVYPNVVLFADANARKATNVAGVSATYFGLRSPSGTAYNAAIVNMSTGGANSGTVVGTGGVRPACIINL